MLNQQSLINNLIFYIMKTRIATLAILIGLFISATAFASEPVPVPASKAVASSVATLIEDELEYPEFAIKDKFQGDVVIELLIEDDGTFNVLKANSYDENMKEHVVEQIENLDSDKFDQYAGQTVLVKVNFDLELY